MTALTDFDSNRLLHRVNVYSAWSLPSTPAQPFDLLWTNHAGDAPRPHRVLPSGEPSIAVRRIRAADGEVTACELVVCCQYTRCCWHSPPPGEEMIALRLKPELAAGQLGIDPVDYVDANPLPLPRALLQRLEGTRRLAESGGDSRSVARQLLQELRLLAGQAAVVSTLGLAVIRLRDSHGMLPMRQLAAELRVSPRTLHRQFVDHLGVSPKFFARRLRLNLAALLSDQSAQVQWADVAAACGFHDQAHLINEYQQLVGLTPTASHRERLGLSDFSNSPLPA